MVSGKNQTLTKKSVVLIFSQKLTQNIYHHFFEGVGYYFFVKIDGSYKNERILALL